MNIRSWTSPAADQSDSRQTTACELRLAGPQMRYEIDWLPLLPMTQEILIQACVHCVNTGDEYVGLSGLGNSKT